LEGLAGIDPILGELPRLAELVLSCQREDGLWNCFVDDPATAPETSGTAGLAAALALSAQAGWIDEEPAQAAARRAYETLLSFVRPDGLLDGVAQSNRGGEELQRSSYRVLSSMGAGLFGQLHAALASSPAPTGKRTLLNSSALS
jgi:rhamnogalacturonyl hydrolase YesR